jgi:hypothetical protein
VVVESLSSPHPALRCSSQSRSVSLLVCQLLQPSRSRGQWSRGVVSEWVCKCLGGCVLCLFLAGGFLCLMGSGRLEGEGGGGLEQRGTGGGEGREGRGEAGNSCLGCLFLKA